MPNSRQVPSMEQARMVLTTRGNMKAHDVQRPLLVVVLCGWNTHDDRDASGCKTTRERDLNERLREFARLGGDVKARSARH